MILSHPEIDTLFDFSADKIHTLVIENPSFMYRFINDIYCQQNGSSGDCILSNNDLPVEFSRYSELLDQFIPFDINRKPLLTKISAALEKNAMCPELYERSMRLLSETEQFLYDISFDLPCDLTFSKVSIPGIIKASGMEVRDEYEKLSEKVIDYMELVREFDHDKLFITVNMRSFVSDEEMILFMETVLSHGFGLLMVENSAHSLLPLEHRTIIDEDLCEIG